MTAQLTHDPKEHRGKDSVVCEMRVACNGRAKDQASGEWGDDPSYFTVKAFAGQAESCLRYLTTGSAIAIDGRLKWREWEPTDGGAKRSTVEIITDTVQFIGGKKKEGDAEPAGASSTDSGQPAGEDDIPF
jgi:single-strand DNA-binding protein